MPFLFLLVYLLAEIALFIWIGGFLGVGWTLLWVLAGFVIGAMMLRRGGSESRKWLQTARAGQSAGNIGKQIYWYIGGLLVMMPGFLTDFIGLMLVFPPTQKLITFIISLFVPETVSQGFAFVQTMGSNNPATRYADPRVIEGEAVEINEPRRDIPES